MWFAMWWGGESYSQGDYATDVETFASLADAKAALYSRESRGYWQPQDFNYIHRAPESVLTPCVGETSEIWLFGSDPAEMADPYPSRVIKFGPRGGIRSERC